MKRQKVTAIILFALGFLSLCLHYSIIPLIPVIETLSLSEMAEEADGLLSSEIAPPWPLKVRKRKLDEITVELGDGTSLSQYQSRATLLLADAQQGFYVKRPQVFILIPTLQKSASDAKVRVGIPVKLRDIFHKIFFSLATCGTKSIAVSTDGLSKFSVGGAILSRIAKTEKIASTAPAAPSK